MRATNSILTIRPRSWFIIKKNCWKAPDIRPKTLAGNKSCHKCSRCFELTVIAPHRGFKTMLSDGLAGQGFNEDVNKLALFLCLHHDDGRALSRNDCWYFERKG